MYIDINFYRVTSNSTPMWAFWRMQEDKSKLTIDPTEFRYVAEFETEGEAVQYGQEHHKNVVVVSAVNTLINEIVYFGTYTEWLITDVFIYYDETVELWYAILVITDTRILLEYMEEVEKEIDKTLLSSLEKFEDIVDRDRQLKDIKQSLTGVYERKLKNLNQYESKEKYGICPEDDFALNIIGVCTNPNCDTNRF